MRIEQFLILLRIHTEVSLLVSLFVYTTYCVIPSLSLNFDVFDEFGRSAKGPNE